MPKYDDQYMLQRYQDGINKATLLGYKGKAAVNFAERYAVQDPQYGTVSLPEVTYQRTDLDKARLLASQTSKAMNTAGNQIAPILFTSLVNPVAALSGLAGGEAVNHLASSTGKYTGWGDMLSLNLGVTNPIGKIALDFTNPGYLLGGLGLHKSTPKGTWNYAALQHLPEKGLFEGSKAYAGRVASLMLDKGKPKVDISLQPKTTLFTPTNPSLKDASLAFFERPVKLNEGIRIPLPKLDMKPFIDEYGKEVIPTPWKGTDLELIDLILKNLINVLRDYFSPLKKTLVMKAMNWGEKEYSEFLDELLRSIGTLTKGEVKGPKDGFTMIALHKGNAVGEGKNMTGLHVMTFNRERLPDEKMATEAIMHEIGGHAKTMSINPNKPNKISEAFPRITLLMLKNQELANNILEFNGRGKFFRQFPKTSDLELYIYNNNIPKHKVEKLFNQRRYFNYLTNDILERAARAYTGLIMDKLGFDKTLNVKQLERYYTPESVEKFKNAVLNYTVPITIGGSTVSTLYNKSLGTHKLPEKL